MIYNKLTLNEEEEKEVTGVTFEDEKEVVLEDEKEVVFEDEKEIVLEDEEEDIENFDDTEEEE